MLPKCMRSTSGKLIQICTQMSKTAVILFLIFVPFLKIKAELQILYAHSKIGIILMISEHHFTRLKCKPKELILISVSKQTHNDHLSLVWSLNAPAAHVLHADTLCRNRELIAADVCGLLTLF